MSKIFKILAIDGGGFRGVYPAHLLKRIEKEFAVRWLESFDLIAGTSTGSIIAASLALGKSAGEVLEKLGFLINFGSHPSVQIERRAL